MVIFQAIGDKWRFLKMLRFFNDEYSPKNLFRQLDFFRKSGNIVSQFQWPNLWPTHKPIVKILAYCLRDNHFHLLLKEIVLHLLDHTLKLFSLNKLRAFLDLVEYLQEFLQPSYPR